jgi:hypothetical protein
VWGGSYLVDVVVVMAAAETETVVRMVADYPVGHLNLH